MTKVYNHITEDEKIKLSRITQDCLDTHVMQPPKTFVNLAVLDRDGNEIERHEMLSKSWVRNAYNVMASALMGCAVSYSASTAGYGAGKMGIKNTSGSIGSTGNYGAWRANHTDILGTSGGDTQGILVGSLDTAEDFEGYNLAGKISNGTGSGQLSYVAQSAPTLVYDSGTKKLTVTHSRFFNNNSGAAIDVKETGWATTSLGVANQIMLNREVLPATVSVPNGAQLKVSIVLELTYPA